MPNSRIDITLGGLTPEVALSPDPLAYDVGVGGPLPIWIGPCESLPVAGGFYDLECDTLFVHILPFAPYHSFLETDQLRIDTDQRGRPVFLELKRPRTEWRTDPKLTVPQVDTDGILSFRETRRRFTAGEIETDPNCQKVCIRLLARESRQVIRLADNLLVETADGFLVAIWILDVQSDFGGRKQTRWRVETSARLRAEGRNWRICTRGKV
jgi:hypothetical protein